MNRDLRWSLVILAIVVAGVTLVLGGVPLGQSHTGPGMMGGSFIPGRPLTSEQVREVAKQYVAAYGNPDLEVAEITEFSNHFYVQARERSTGRFAFEFLIDRTTGRTYPEPGPEPNVEHQVWPHGR